MTRDLAGTGTSEARWQASGVLDALPLDDAAACRPRGRVVVVAPHPDDEVLGAGATLAVWAAAGTPILVVAVTDGEASHPGSPTLGRSALAVRRADERRRALAVLGLDPDAVRRLLLPDGAVAADDVAAALTGLLAPDDVCLAPVAGDGHPDHDATAAGSRRVAGEVGATVWGYAVWLWHWSTPHDPEVSFAAARRVRAAGWARRAKAEAIACYLTQIAALSTDPRDAAVLPGPVLARLDRRDEVLWLPE